MDLENVVLTRMEYMSVGFQKMHPNFPRVKALVAKDACGAEQGMHCRIQKHLLEVTAQPVRVQKLPGFRWKVSQRSLQSIVAKQV